MNNQPGKLILDKLADLFQAQNALLENNNPIKFKHPFTGSNYETLTWIFAAEKYLRVNDFKSPKIQFQRIFSSMHENYQNRYLIDTRLKDNNLTFDCLKAWVLKEYPPPKTKYEFKLALKAMIMYKNEDPNIAYSRFKYKLAKIERAIEIINEGLKAQSQDLYPGDDNKMKEHYDSIKLLPISSEDQREALTRMFVIRNNKSEWNNDGTINDLVHKRILKRDPLSMGDWDATFNEMKRNLIARIVDGQKQYEYTSYPVSKDDDSIYIKKHHRTTTQNRQMTPIRPTIPRPKGRKPKLNKKRGRDSKNDRNEPNQKRSKYGTCSRCRKPGHYVKDCFATTDIHGNPISSPPPNKPPKCDLCGEKGHTGRRCYYREKIKTKKCHNCGTIGHLTRACTRSAKDKSPRHKNGFSTYPSSNKHQNQNQPPPRAEVNAMSASNSAPDLDVIRQWADNNTNMNDSVRDSLHEIMNQLASTHPRK